VDVPVTDDPFADFRGLEFMESRIPVLDALSTFVPDAQPLAPEVELELKQHGQQRWYPVPGGHRVLVPPPRGAVAPVHFAVEAGAWDHDTCDRCVTHIPAMTLCWVTRNGRYLTLCVECKSKMSAAAQQ
jgi:hypothetical protein